MANRLVYFVIGDSELNAGNGVFLQSLTQLRGRLLDLRIDNDWTLVISIHGSETRIADTEYVPASGAGAYDAAAIARMFSDREFVRWRDRRGPVRVVLNSCQVGAPFERTLIESLTKAGSGQLVQGLGDDCRPGTTTMTLEEEINGQWVSITTMAQFLRLPQDRQDAHRASLLDLNREWGYFGAPPVPESQVLEYYFHEEPRGGWPVVRVTHERQDTNIPFYNRATHTEFHQLCDQGIGTLRPRNR